MRWGAFALTLKNTASICQQCPRLEHNLMVLASISKIWLRQKKAKRKWLDVKNNINQADSFSNPYKKKYI